MASPGSISEKELNKGLEKLAGVDVQQTSDADICRQMFRVLKMDASVPVDSRVFSCKSVPCENTLQTTGSRTW